MRTSFPLLSLIVFACLFNSAFAHTYYFSSSTGDDSRTFSEARNQITPWKTLSQLNSFFTNLRSGDSVLFKRGDIFYGKIVIGASGSSVASITIGAYGTGANPVITGFTTVSSWTNLGNNIWESKSPVSNQTAINMVVINGVNTPMGRYPNSGYLTYQSFTATTKTSTSLSSGTTNWRGAIAVIRLHHWITDADTILSHSGNTFTHSVAPNPTTYNGRAGYGFFIQNDERTLDQQNEWYYNGVTKKLKVYSTSAPANLQIPTIDTLVFMQYKRYITFEHLSFTGSNKSTFVINSCPGLTIQNCVIDYSGQDAIWGGQNWGPPFSPHFKLKNSIINHTNNNAIKLANEFTSALISNTTVKNTGMIAGMGKSGDETYNAIYIRSSDGIIENCTIDSTGYVPIHFRGNNFIVRNNFISNYCMTKMDGGGVYTWVGSGSPDVNVKVTNNIIINSAGDVAGTTEEVPLIHGIYLDANTANVEVYGNTAANLAYSGLYIYSGSHDNNIHDNTFYNNGRNQMLQTNHFTSGRATENNLINSNIFFSRSANQYTAVFNTRNSLAAFATTAGTFDENYYVRPIDDSLTIGTVSNNSSIIKNTLAGWKSVSGQDANSNKSPLRITDVNDLRFEYNGTNQSKTVSLPFNYVDARRRTYNGTITLSPFTSAVLIKNGAVTTNASPTANAGVDETLTLPTNEFNLQGIGTDPDGSISEYSWTKVSGPSEGTITNPDSHVTLVENLVEGVYYFQFTVTDNLGATGFDTIQITVNPAEIGVQAYPNPIGNSIKINIAGAAVGEYKVILVDALGRVIWIKTGIKNAGSVQLEVDALALQKGIYFLRVEQNNNSAVLKLLK